MRILFDQAAHDMRNKGNNALLEVATKRLLKIWPNAAVDIITLAPNLTRLYYPFARPVTPDNFQPYSSKFWKLLNVFPSKIVELIFELREEISHRRSRKINHSLENNNIDGITTENFTVEERISSRQNINVILSGYNMVVASGGGYFCDSDKPRLLRVFDRLESAAESGIPAVMVSQGIGPLNDVQLRSRAAHVLPKLDLICVRETRVALPILRDLGVPDSKIIMTGDDAIEMAYKARAESLGEEIGVSVRITSYTQVGLNHIEEIRKMLLNSANKYRVALAAIPISSAHHESDILQIRALLNGYKPVDIGWRKLDSPGKLIKRVGRCRIVVTGTYHGAVFALAQGIPVICLANSDEYFYKLSGLTDEFGSGCQVLNLKDNEFTMKFPRIFDKLWESAKDLKPELLAAAVRQVEWGQKAYHRIQEIVTNYQTNKDSTAKTTGWKSSELNPPQNGDFLI